MIGVTEMRIPTPHRKSRVHRFLDKLSDPFDAPSTITSNLPSLSSDNARRAGLIVTALTGLTAGSAGISSASRSSAPAAPRADGTRAPLVLSAVPDRRRRLGTVVLVPADVSDSSSAPQSLDEGAALLATAWRNGSWAA